MKPNTPVLRLPLNFDRRGEVALLARETGSKQWSFLLWLEWANERKAWRALQSASADAIDWSDEPLSYIVESFVAWTGDPGGLMRGALAAGVYKVDLRGDQLGIVLAGFVDYNAELLPGYQSPGQLGGAVNAVKRHRKDAAALARQQVRVEQARQDELILPSGITHQQREAGIALICTVDRVCQHATRQQFDNLLIEDAVAALETTQEETVDKVLSWLVGQRSNPEVVMQTERVLRDWSSLVEQVAPPHDNG